MNKPLTVERQEYMRKLVEATNACPLPAVFKADVMDAALRKLREVADQELKRDMEAYAAEQAAQEPTDTEGQPKEG
jgi:hypothetical protein